jgi:nicotinamidase-related amidase
MPSRNALGELPLPAHYDPEKIAKVWKVPYQERAQAASQWAQQQGITPAAQDEFKIGLFAVDLQNTFCLPDFELFVAGRSGTGAVDDNRRLVEFIYRNLGSITGITVTMDTHQAIQIFHAIFLVNDRGEHPAPLTLITLDDLQEGRWKFNPAVAPSLGITPQYGQRYLLHYARQLADRQKYDLTIWPYHSMFGGIGHALVASVEEAFFFHTIARQSQVDFIIKGRNPLSEHYSAIGPEVLQGPDGEQIDRKSQAFIDKLENLDAVVVAGQAKSHCVAWTLDDLLADIRARDRGLASKVYLLEDCSSPVVVPGVVDYTQQADQAYQRFTEAGMHLVCSTDPLATWPGIKAAGLSV